MLCSQRIAHSVHTTPEYRTVGESPQRLVTLTEPDPEEGSAQHRLYNLLQYMGVCCHHRSQGHGHCTSNGQEDPLGHGSQPVGLNPLAVFRYLCIRCLHCNPEHKQNDSYEAAVTIVLWSGSAQREAPW